MSVQSAVFGAPIPGESLTKAPKSVPWEKPPQFTKLSEVMNYMMSQLTQSMHLKQLLQMMDAGMPIEAITRTLIFTGFATGKWGVDLAMLMYKPLMMSLIALAHRAGLKNTPVVMPKAVTEKKLTDLKSFMIANKAKGMREQVLSADPTVPPPQEASSPSMGFMQRRGVE